MDSLGFARIWVRSARQRQREVNHAGSPFGDRSCPLSLQRRPGRRNSHARGARRFHPVTRLRVLRPTGQAQERSMRGYGGFTARSQSIQYEGMVASPPDPLRSRGDARTMIHRVPRTSRRHQLVFLIFVRPRVVCRSVGRLLALALQIPGPAGRCGAAHSARGVSLRGVFTHGPSEHQRSIRSLLRSLSRSHSPRCGINAGETDPPRPAVGSAPRGVT